MRNLKRVLSLALALVMMLGMMVIGANAASAEFPDADKITYTEAVNVMNGLGILVGDENGNFNPTGILTREQAAKIICYMLIGAEFADQLAGMGTGSFADVAADRWSAGYIDYCANLGIIAGNGDGNFGPEDELTGVAFAKMLLVAIGNDAEERGYVGANWATNVAVDAFNAGINIDGVLLSADLTREQAAEMAFRALNYTADGGTTKYVVTNADDVVIYSGTNEDTAALIAGLTTGAILNEVTTNEGSLGDRIYGLTEGKSTDEFGRVSKTWTNGKDGKDEVVYASFEPTAVKTYTTATTYGKILTDLGLKVADKVTLNVFTNSATATKVENVTRADTTDVGGQGTLIEVYKTADKTYSLIVVDTYAKQLAKDDIVAAKAATATTDATDAYIKLSDELTFDTDAFKKDDVVLYTVADGKVVNVVKAPSVTGTVTATGEGYIRVNGEKMVTAKNNIDDVTIGTTDGYKYDADTTYTYYLDSYGNIVTAVKGSVAPAEENYIYVISVAAKAAKNDTGDLYETVAGSAAVAQAKVMDLGTGEISIVNQGVVKGTDNKYYYAAADGSSSSDVVADTGDTNSSIEPVEAIYTYYTLDDGSVVLGNPVDTTNVSLKKGVAQIANGLYANATTTVTILEYTENYKSVTKTSYTGLANFPATADTGAALVNADEKTGAVNSVVIVKPAQPVETTPDYAVFAGLGEYGANGQAYAFYVKGEQVDYYLAKNVTAESAGVSGLKKGDVVTVKLTDGKLAASAVADASEKQLVAGEVTYATDTFLVIDGAVYYFGNNCETYDADADYAAASVEIGDTVSVYGTVKDDVNTAAFILIAEAE